MEKDFFLLSVLATAKNDIEITLLFKIILFALITFYYLFTTETDPPNTSRQRWN